MGSHCHSHGTKAFDGASPAYKKVLVIVSLINLLMFVVESLGGYLSGSVALQADALDFLADFLTYGSSLLVIGRALRVRASIAIVKGISLAVMALYVAGMTLYRTIILGVPEVYTMSVIGILALTTNVASVLLLYRWRDGDANVRSVWLCSRSDAIGNVAVILAAGLVAWTGTGWPDIAVAAFMAVLFLNSAAQIIRQALQELAKTRSLP